jgi:hypothetical protein
MRPRDEAAPDRVHLLPIQPRFLASLHISSRTAKFKFQMFAPHPPASTSRIAMQEFTFIVPAFGRQKEKRVVVTLNKATPLMAFAAQVSDKISDREGRIRCLLASFPDQNDASADSLLRRLKDQREKCRKLGSRDQPRVDRIVDVPPPASSASRPKLPEVPVFTAKDMEAKAAQVGREVAKDCKHAFQIALNASAAVHMYVARRVFINVCARYHVHCF